LAAILGFTDLLLEKSCHSRKPPREDLQIILHETQRTKDIVQDLLSFARQRPVQREFGAAEQTCCVRRSNFAATISPVTAVEVTESFEDDLAPATGRRATAAASVPEYSQQRL